jgi:hypothetical protein
MRSRHGLVAVSLLVLVVAGCASQPRTAGGDGGVVVGGSGASVTGEVVSFTSDVVTLQTAGGRETLRLDGDTVGREHLIVGQRVSVETLLTGGASVARRIGPATAAGG